MVERASEASSPGRVMMRTKTALSPTTKVGTPKTWWVVTAASCALRNASRGPPSATVASTSSPSTPAALEDVADHRLVAQVEPAIVASGEQPEVDVEEAVGEVVPHDQAGLDGEEVGGLGGVIPYRGPTFLDVGLGQRERGELDVPIRSSPQGHHQMLVGVAGEGAAVVVGDGENVVGSWLGQHLDGTATFQPAHRPRLLPARGCGRAARARPRGSTRHHVGGVVEPACPG